MAKPRMFISSTFYDLRQVRSDIDFFIDQMGYEAVRHEEGDIPYGKDEALEEYCYKEINNIDILICIIGGRFGSESKSNPRLSVTQSELKAAITAGKQVYIFIEMNVMTEFETYLLNKDERITFKFVDNRKIYQFIEEIKSLSTNNIIKGFETATDIVKFLKEQLAGLFQRLLEKQSRLKEVNLIKGLESTAQTLKTLVDFLTNENKGKEEEINRILMINHPLVDEIKKKLDIGYNFYFEGVDDVTKLVNARGFKFEENPYFEDFIINYIWTKDVKQRKYILRISKSVFEEDGKLKFIKISDWDEAYVSLESIDEKEEDDLPF